MNILEYQDWMRPQVIDMFAREYRVDPVIFERQFLEFYESSFQKEQCIRIVAEENGKVGGFQSFFYWPIQMNGEIIKAYQSGNSLVHPDFRGKGLFTKMLDYINSEKSTIEIDLLIGFPVEASYKSFIKNNWKNPFNLQWYVCPMQPVQSLIGDPSTKLSRHFQQRHPENITWPAHIVGVAQDQQFDAYRFQFQLGHYFRFKYEGLNASVLFEFKIHQRKKWLRELIIGKMVSSTDDMNVLETALKALKKEVRKAGAVSMMSIAVNNQTAALRQVLVQSGFRKIKREIYFIAKGPKSEAITDWSNWWLNRGDIDTW